MLDALALIAFQKFDDLPCLATVFVHRDPDAAARRGQRPAVKPGKLAFDVEKADLAEVEEAGVEIKPDVHPALVDIVGEVVDDFEAMAHGVAICTFNEFKVDVVNASAVFVTVDQIQGRTADTFDGRQS